VFSSSFFVMFFPGILVLVRAPHQICREKTFSTSYFIFLQFLPLVLLQKLITDAVGSFISNFWMIIMKFVAYLIYPSDDSIYFFC
jgi:hypothetical protein